VVGTWQVIPTDFTEVLALNGAKDEKMIVPG